MKRKQVSLSELQLAGPEIGERIEYAPYLLLHEWRPAKPGEWVPAVVTGKALSPRWPNGMLGGKQLWVDRVAIYLEWIDRGRVVKDGCFADHEGYTWRHTGSTIITPNPYR